VNPGNLNLAFLILLPAVNSPYTILALLVLPLHAQVTTTADSVPGSLRQIIAGAPSGSTVTFAPHLSGQTLGLTNGLISITKSVTIDASALANGVIIDGHGRNSLFHCGSQTTNTFIGLTLTGGRTTIGGGAILNDSVLTLNQCTFAGNIANEGGAIFNFTTLTLNHCTLVGNYARYGGAIEGDGGPLTLNHCTLVGNFATNDGGGILNFFTVTLNHCTVVGNHAFYGGGIDNFDTLNLNNSIVAANTASLEPQIAGAIDSSGVNLTSGDPLLAPLGDYGGPTRTMPPLPGSPAIDPAGGDAHSVFSLDQRGLARVVGARVDIGAAEFHPSDVALFWPTDWDDDGNPFGLELALGLNPLRPDTGAAGTPRSYPPAVGNGIEFGFNDAATNYTAWVVKRSFDLSVSNSFVEIFRLDGPTGATTQTNDLTVNRTLDSIRIVDNTNPRPPSAYYLLSIEPRR
jgi:hypothetical protein